MGTYGTANGLVLVFDKTAKIGKLLGLLGGELQAYFDSDGSIKWAGGMGKADSTGLEFVVDANNYFKMLIGGTAGASIYIATNSRNYGIVANGLDVGVDGRASRSFGVGTSGTSTGDGGIGAYGYATGVDGIGVKGYAAGQDNIGVLGISSNGSAAVKAQASGTTPYSLMIFGKPVDGGSQRYTALADAIADTDAMNRQSCDARGDARYTGITTGTIDGGVW